MLEIIENGQIINDQYTRANDTLSFDTVRISVSWSQWQEHRERLLEAKASEVIQALAVRIGPAMEIEQIAADQSHFDLIVLEFEAFTDGRPFSTAQLLRDKYGFSGQIRAEGDIVPDQLAFLIRCGFDQIVLPQKIEPESFLQRFPSTYQSGFGDYQHIRALRRGTINTGTLEHANGD